MIPINKVFSQQEINEFLSQGYSLEQIQQAINESEANAIRNSNLSPLQMSYQQAKNVNANDPRSIASNSYIMGSGVDNLIQWQLELDSILERVEHLLRGDKPTWTQGSIIWQTPKNDEEKKFNELGVSEIMQILSTYVNRNTILSNYNEEMINDKMYDLGNEVNDFIYLRYEEIGLTTPNKRKIYPITIRPVLDIIHSAYLRALNGGERESLREARQVTQTEGLSQMNMPMGDQPLKQRGILNPFRYIKGKYV